jgi:hypothetical protein
VTLFDLTFYDSFLKVSNFNLTTGQQYNDVNFVAVLRRPFQFIRVGALIVEVNFNEVAQAALFIKQPLPQTGTLPDKVVNACPDGGAGNWNALPAGRKFTMGFVKVYIYRHGDSLSQLSAPVLKYGDAPRLSKIPVRKAREAPIVCYWCAEQRRELGCSGNRMPSYL